MKSCKFTNLTTEDIATICNPDYTAKELSIKYNIGTATVSRWRKKLQATVPRGSKLGKKKPWQIVDRIVTKCRICNDNITHLLSRPRKVCSRICQSIYMKSADKSYMQTEKYRLSKTKSTTPAYQKYRGRVDRLTQKNYNMYKDVVNPDNFPRTVSGVKGGYQLDHIIPVKHGFDNNIPPETISEVSNLRMLPWKDNLKKSTNII